MCDIINNLVISFRSIFCIDSAHYGIVCLTDAVVYCVTRIQATVHSHLLWSVYLFSLLNERPMTLKSQNGCWK